MCDDISCVGGGCMCVMNISLCGGSVVFFVNIFSVV